MADFRIVDTTLTDRPAEDSAMPFVYQHIRVRDLQLPELAAHAAVAAAAAHRIFGIDFRPDLRLTDSLCRQMLLRNRYPQELSACVLMQLCADGTAHYRCDGIFAHNGLTFNPVRPEAVSFCYDIPFGDSPTSVRLAAHTAAMAAARRQGMRAVVRCNAAGELATACDAPVFAVFGRRIVTPPAEPSVERDRAVTAAVRAGYELSESIVERAMLTRADELFYSDCRGITALARCDGRTYADIIARSVAARLEK